MDARVKQAKGDRMMQGKVYLIGAGPGDPGLITVKGMKCLSAAAVVVYDRLVNPRLLGYIRSDAEVIYAGKSPERHALKQEEINALLVEKARAGKIVARLKGGDPFVFGRGGEEAEALREAGIDFEVVPGVTAAVAVPAYAGIPVTHRDFTSSFTVITGNEDPAKPDSALDWDRLAHGGTLVFLMGMANLSRIATRLKDAGLPGTTPVAVIQWGTTAKQRTVTGSLDDICTKVAAVRVTNPAVVVVGGVVALREKLAWFERGPLFGRRIVVTRAREQASVLAEAIAALGGEAFEFPTIRIEPPADWSAFDAAIGNAQTYDWLIFTSVNGVRFFFRRLRELNRDIRSFYRAAVAAIGPGTRAALEERGLVVAYMPEEFRADAIAAGLKERAAAGARVLLPRADIAPDSLPRALAKNGFVVDNVVAYRTVPEHRNAGMLREMLRAGAVDAVTFTSSSTVKNLVAALGPGAVELLDGVAVASIGPVTSATARELGLKVTVEAKQYTIPSLVEALAGYFGGTGREGQPAADFQGRGLG
ncbi:uroporphyrinogen-III C-methyltransferase [Thermodesulfitimonas autotrophica]|uniref:uroporphyrinogen-III C-methyltransferase n=1 Tax=Thermodesulfitimonas autotrophica TaxID=1894989 RepID=UPI002FE2B7F0